MTLQEYIKTIEYDINELVKWDEEIAPLCCCDHTELKVLNNVLEALQKVDGE